MMACLLLAAMSAICQSLFPACAEMSAICQSLFPACAEMLCGSVKRVVLRRRFAGCSLALAVQLCLVEFASANKVCGGGSIPARFDDAARKERCELFPSREKSSVGFSGGSIPQWFDDAEREERFAFAASGLMREKSSVSFVGRFDSAGF